MAFLFYSNSFLFYAFHFLVGSIRFYSPPTPVNAFLLCLRSAHFDSGSYPFSAIPFLSTSFLRASSPTRIHSTPGNAVSPRAVSFLRLLTSNQIGSLPPRFDSVLRSSNRLSADSSRIKSVRFHRGSLQRLSMPDRIAASPLFAESDRIASDQFQFQAAPRIAKSYLFISTLLQISSFRIVALPIHFFSSLRRS